MKFIPTNNFIIIENIEKENEHKTFEWSKGDEALIAVRLIAFPENSNLCYTKYNSTAIVFSTMIQEFEFNKEKFKIIPESAIVCFVE